MYYRSLFSACRYRHYAHRMAAWLHGRRILQAIPEGHGKVTPMMWDFTRFNGDVPFDEEIRNLIAMEERIDVIPGWAVDAAVQIDALPHCGHLNFPEPVFAVFRGIGKEQPEPSFTFCFEASSETKTRIGYFIEVLEGWIQEKTREEALSDWPDVEDFIVKTYASLGSSTELKRLLVEHIALYLRLSIEELTTNDKGLLMIQTDTGDIKSKTEEQKQRLREVAEREGFDVDRFFREMEHPWLCHQRLFDQIDVTLKRIGHEESHYDYQQARQDAKRYAEQMRLTYDICINGITSWLSGDEPETSLREDSEKAMILENTYDVLGKQTPVKVWLASAFRKKMTIFREHDLEDTLAV